MSCCCPGSCPCPDSGPLKCQTGDKWRKGKCSVGPLAKQEPCCMCDADCTGDTPHAAWVPYNEGCGRFEDKCACECDLEQAGQIGEWVYTYAPLYTTDEDGNLVAIPDSEDTSKPTSRTWDGECPDGVKNSPAIPDLIECDCKCRYDFYENLCVEENNEDWGSDPDPDICGCICNLTNADCEARDPATPTADNEGGNCRCICDISPTDCKGPTPLFDSSKCECYCDKLDANGDHTCSGDSPDFDEDKCECYCATTSCPEGEKLEGCECVPCPNSCSGCESQDANCNCTGCEQCDQTPYIDSNGYTVCCPSLNVLCNDQCVDANCEVGKTFNWSTCECECRDGKELCNGSCKEPCAEGESRDENCVCYDASSQSLLKSLDLLP